MFFLNFGLILLISWLVVDSWHCGEFPHILIMIWVRFSASWAFMTPIILRLLRTFTMWAFVVIYPVGRDFKDIHGKDKNWLMDPIARWLVKHRIYLTDRATWISYSVVASFVVGFCTVSMFTVFPDEDKTRDFKQSTLSPFALSIPVAGYGAVCALILVMVWKMRSDAYLIKREFQLLAVLFLPLMGPGLPLSLINEDTRKWGLFLRILYLNFVVAISFCGVLIMSYRWDRDQSRARFSPSYQSTVVATSDELEEQKDNFWVRMYDTYGSEVFKRYINTYCLGDDVYYVALILFNFVIFVDDYKKSTNDTTRFGEMCRIENKFVDRRGTTPIFYQGVTEDVERVFEEIKRLKRVLEEDPAMLPVDSLRTMPDDLFDVLETGALNELDGLFGSSFMANYGGILTEILSSKDGMIKTR